MSQVYKIEVPYQSCKIIKELAPSQYEELREEFPEFELPDDQTKVPDWNTYTVHGTQRDLDILARWGLEPQIRRIRGQFIDRLNLPANRIPAPEAGQVVNITIPSAGLFAVQTVDVLEDLCTNELQGWLDAGWRIVAVCPPNDTRRPTYIVGHPDKEARRP